MASGSQARELQGGHKADSKAPHSGPEGGQHCSVSPTLRQEAGNILLSSP